LGLKRDIMPTYRICEWEEGDAVGFIDVHTHEAKQTSGEPLSKAMLESISRNAFRGYFTHIPDETWERFQADVNERRQIRKAA